MNTVSMKTAATRSLLLAGTALAALALTQPAQAQVQKTGFFGTLGGWYIVNSGSDSVNDLGSIKPAPDDGWGGDGLFGYRFDDNIDVAGALQGNWLNHGSDRGHYLGYPGSAREKADYWTADGEMGYNGVMGQLGWRLFGGVRYAEFDHNANGGLNFDGTPYTGRRSTHFWGIGPRVGTDVSYRLGESKFSLFGDLSGAALFGKINERANASDGFSLSDGHSRTAWNAEGQVGVAYEVADNINLGVGYRGDAWWGVGDDTATTSHGGGVDRFMHGPFVRVTYNFGAPPKEVRVAAAPAPMPAPPPVATKRNYLVFFDFDKSNITAEAQKTITEAASTARSGNFARITVTGHTDRAGSDQYNMALSLRRAQAVKDALVRQGIPANEITMVGRGESEPLVPTADGVREPQNRRVEIVLG